jgi:hypothetical protein
MSARPKVVIASPHKIEREMLGDWIAAEGLEPVCASSAVTAAHGLGSRLYDLLVVDAGFAFNEGLVYAASRGGAHTPAIVVGDAEGRDEARATRHGAMYVSRPVDRTAFLCSVSLALVDGRTPRRSPRKALAKTPVTVDGQPSFLIDVSNEGLRLEIPRRHGGPSPSPIFIVHVPVLGIALSVHRVWVGSAPASSGPAAWCGAALGSNSSRAEQSWRSFVASVPA